MGRRAYLISFSLGVLFVTAAGLGQWLYRRTFDLSWRHLSIGSILIAAWLLAYTWWKRQMVKPLTPLAYRRLGVFGLSVSVLLAIVSSLFLAYDGASTFVHPRRIPLTRSPEAVGIEEYQPVSFPSADGLVLRGWYIPSRNGAVVICVHGLGSNREAFLEDAALLAAHDYGVLLFDLRNSGESEGTLTTLGLHEVKDVRGAVDFVLSQPDVDPARLGLLGHSLGGGTVLLAGPDLPQVRSFVVQNAFTSAEDNIETTLKVFTGLPPFPFAPLVIFFGEREVGAEISQIRPVDEIPALSPRPVLIMHGALDEIIPLANAFSLYDAASQPKELCILPTAGHSGLLAADPQEYERCLLGFLDKYLLEP